MGIGERGTARRVSVVVPTCNRPQLLPRALASVFALRANDIALEVLVADNGHGSDAKDTAARFGARYLKVTERGPSQARNAALFAADGDYIAFLDDDDAWLPEHLRPHLAALEARPELEGVFGQLIHTNEANEPFGEVWPADDLSDNAVMLLRMLSGFFPQIGTVVVRADVRKRIGGFDPELQGGEDLDWLLRMAGAGTLGFVAAPTLHFRVRDMGTYDDLERERVAYDRKVFHRHALKLWRTWGSPVDYLRAYCGTLAPHYDYFASAALSHAGKGDRRAALQAAFIAMRILPHRAAKQMFSPADRPIRRAVAQALTGARSPTGKGKVLQDGAQPS